MILCACCAFLLILKLGSVVFRCFFAFCNDKDVFLWTSFFLLFPTIKQTKTRLLLSLFQRNVNLRAKGFLCTIDLISAPGFQEQVELDVVGVNGETNARTAQLFGGLVNPNFYNDAGAVLFGCPRDDLRRVRKNW